MPEQVKRQLSALQSEDIMYFPQFREENEMDFSAESLIVC